MKTSSRKLNCYRLRVLPGRILRFTPFMLKHLDWKVGDKLVVNVLATGRIEVLKLPTEREWRIKRLARRLNPATASNKFVPTPWPDRYVEFRTMANGRSVV